MFSSLTPRSIAAEGGRHKPTGLAIAA
jgi:hypothetical protein